MTSPTRVDACATLSRNMAKALHSEQVKARAIALAVEHGPAEAQRILANEGHHVKPTTLRTWCSRAGVVTVTAERTAAATKAAHARWEERRATMVHEIGDVAQMALDHARTALQSDKGRDAKDYATTMAILVDKAQLLSGGSTVTVGTPAEKTRIVEQARDAGLSLVPHADAA